MHFPFNIPDDLCGAVQLGKNDWCIYWQAQNNQVSTWEWTPDRDYKILGYLYRAGITANTIASSGITQNLYGTIFTSNPLILAVDQSIVVEHNFNDYYIYEGNLISIAATTTQPSFLFGCLYLREIDNQIPEKIRTKCGICDWLRGECIHGLS